MRAKQAVEHARRQWVDSGMKPEGTYYRSLLKAQAREKNAIKRLNRSIEKYKFYVKG